MYQPVWESLVKIKDSRSVSNNEADIFCRIYLVLRQQQCWKFASVTKHLDAAGFRKLGYHNLTFTGILNINNSTIKNEMCGR
jgi:hypothetical protein